jgi:hypothetical protein
MNLGIVNIPLRHITSLLTTCWKRSNLDSSGLKGKFRTSKFSKSETLKVGAFDTKLWDGKYTRGYGSWKLALCGYFL